MCAFKPPTVVREGRLTFSQYTAIHQKIRKSLGKPKLCVKCGASGDGIYEWANISGDYRLDADDWMRLCRSCHVKQHKPRHYPDYCTHGHKQVLTNIYMFPHSKQVYCRECKRKFGREYQRRRRLRLKGLAI